MKAKSNIAMVGEWIPIEKESKKLASYMFKSEK